MENLNNITNESKILSKITSGLIQGSNQCYKHIPTKYTEDNTSREEWISLHEKFSVNTIVLEGIVVCPRCEIEKQDAEFSKQVNGQLYEQQRRKKLNTLGKRSILQDETIKAARFDNYMELGPEETENKRQAFELTKLMKQGKNFNLWIQSEITGVGKSHLAMSVLKEVNSLDCSTLFLDIDQMLRLIRGSFNDKESMYTEEYFIELAAGVDVLALDDLGAETGDIYTEKRASDYTSRILRAIMNGRQDKTTIITTNLTGKQLNNIYDRKVISRLMANLKTIKFVNSKDKRVQELDF